MDTAKNDRLTFSDAVAAIKGTQSASGWYNGHCPAHSDSKSSLGIKERPDGSFAIKCQTGCTRKAVVAALEERTGKKLATKKKDKEKRPPAEKGITLDQYSKLKQLPREYLSEYGVGEVLHQGKPAIAHYYFDVLPAEVLANPPAIAAENITPEEALSMLQALGFVGAKLRLSTDSHDTLWANFVRSVPYGLMHLHIFAELKCKLPPWVVICEGESDTETLYFNDIPALGISGKTGWKPEFAKNTLLANVKEVFIVQEPDAEDFVKQVADSFPDKKVYVVKLPVKDPSAMWIAICQLYESLEDRWKYFRVCWLKVLSDAMLIHDGFANTDTGNAERLVDQYGAFFRYVMAENQFYVWNNCVWEKNDTGDILLPHTKDVARAIPNPEWRIASEAAAKRKAMIAMSKGENSVWAKTDTFDAQPMLLNVTNGTLDLETGNLREFSREDFLTKQAQVAYDPFATCPKFDEFLKFTFAGDQETIHFVLKALGYTLTGQVGESCFFICYGLGANGKTTLIEIMQQILGHDFARPAKFSTFVHSRMHDPKYEIATFKGARMITAVEPRKAGHLDEEVLKQITGGDKIMARDIYQKNVVYYPEFKLWLAMNNKPRIIGTDEGIWRRVRMIPFTVRVPESRKIKEFHKVLFREEGPGILNRLVDGLQDWLSEGLNLSGAVEKATKEFRLEQNVIQQFFDNHTITGQKEFHAPAGALYERYRSWAESNNEFVIRLNEFAEELARRGFVKRRTSAGVDYWGIGLKSV